MSRLCESYRSVGGLIDDYWCAYGGWSAVMRSPYLHVAILLTLALAPSWANRDWWNSVIQVLPNIVGFSIGGYAIWLGFGDEKFKALMAESDGEGDISPYMEVSATFCHFVIVQVAAVVFALGASALNFYAGDFRVFRGVALALGTDWANIAEWLRNIGAGVGVLLFMYALTTALAAVLAIFQVAQWFDKFRSVSTLGSRGRTRSGEVGARDVSTNDTPKGSSGDPAKQT